jgi:DNA-directed RNA polymerase specialized sigma24 family protein
MAANQSRDEARRSGAQRYFCCVLNLRAFAMSVLSSLDRADDLVQETLLCAIQNRWQSSQSPLLIAAQA